MVNNHAILYDCLEKDLWTRPNKEFLIVSFVEIIGREPVMNKFVLSVSECVFCVICRWEFYRNCKEMQFSFQTTSFIPRPRSILNVQHRSRLLSRNESDCSPTSYVYEWRGILFFFISLYDIAASNITCTFSTWHILKFESYCVGIV